MVIPKRPVADILRRCGLEEAPKPLSPRRHVDRYGGLIRVVRRRRRILPDHGEWDTLEAWLYEGTSKGWRLSSHWRPQATAGKLKAPAPWAVGPADPPRPADDHWPALLEMSA